MSVLTSLREIEEQLRKPLLDVQDQMNEGLAAMGGLRNLLAGQGMDHDEGLVALVTMIDAQFRRANEKVNLLAQNTFGHIPH
jgi:hypothetical protein